MRTIEIVITPEGKTTLQTLGFSGPSCRDASRFLERALGQQTAEQLTAEFHQAETVSQRHSQQA
jgi:hypothetical protein